MSIKNDQTSKYEGSSYLQMLYVLCKAWYSYKTTGSKSDKFFIELYVCLEKNTPRIWFPARIFVYAILINVEVLQIQLHELIQTICFYVVLRRAVTTAW